MSNEQRFITRDAARMTIEGRTVRGYAALYNQWSNILGANDQNGKPIEFREVIQRGAFGELSRFDICMFWQHDNKIVLGRTSAGTLRLADDEYGVRFECDIPKSYEFALEAIELKNVTGMSFSAGVVRDAWARTGVGDIWAHTISDARLIEISPVTWAAYSGPFVSRSMPPARLDAAERRLLQLAPTAPKR